MSELRVKKLVQDAIIPTRGSGGAVGYDLYSVDEVVLPPSQRTLVGTGVAVVLPMKVYGRVAPRSGLTVKHGIHVGAGVIDPDYTGEIKVALFNLGDGPFEVKKGDRIAQLILERCETPYVREITEISETERGDGGFGSTGA
jgi:dUTP pyrophosphatase